MLKFSDQLRSEKLRSVPFQKYILFTVSPKEFSITMVDISEIHLNRHAIYALFSQSHSIMSNRMLSEWLGASQLLKQVYINPNYRHVKC